MDFPSSTFTSDIKRLLRYLLTLPVFPTFQNLINFSAVHNLPIPDFPENPPITVVAQTTQQYLEFK